MCSGAWWSYFRTCTMRMPLRWQSVKTSFSEEILEEFSSLSNSICFFQQSYLSGRIANFRWDLRLISNNGKNVPDWHNTYFVWCECQGEVNLIRKLHDKDNNLLEFISSMSLYILNLFSSGIKEITILCDITGSPKKPASLWSVCQTVIERLPFSIQLNITQCRIPRDK